MDSDEIFTVRKLQMRMRVSSKIGRAGDLRRALAAAERLAMLCGDVRPWERRDAGRRQLPY